MMAGFSAMSTMQQYPLVERETRDEVCVKDFSKETDARIVIDGLLRQAGWEPADKSQILTEVSVRDLSGRIGDPPVPYGKRPSSNAGDRDEVLLGRADYVLLDQRGRPLAVIEAKRSATQPYTAKQQALPYAKQMQAPFIFLTNGELIYFWDYTNDDAQPTTTPISSTLSTLAVTWNGSYTCARSASPWRP
jgi:type I site-specific restriction endonuclease